MTPAQHAARIRQLRFKLEKADFGLGMPRDDQLIRELQIALQDALKDLELTLTKSEIEP